MRIDYFIIARQWIIISHKQHNTELLESFKHILLIEPLAPFLVSY